MAESPEAARLRQKLRIKFSMPEWAFFEEVGVLGGRADALAINLWRSRGHAVYGFEVKARLEDLRREIREPAKADLIASGCDRFFLVMPRELASANVLLPDAWGVIVPSGRGLRILREGSTAAPRLTEERCVAAAIVRRAMAVDETRPDEEALRLEHQRGYRRGCGQMKEDLSRDIGRAEALRAEVDKFEKASGVRISGYTDGGRIGAAVSVVMNGDRRTEALVSRLRTLRDDSAEMLRKLEGGNDG